MFKTWGIDTTQINKNIPCKIAESFVFPPDYILAELLRITWVIGIPPISPERIFPLP